jgi:hypothetical protein
MAAGTTIYACYDNTVVTTDQSHPSSTWNNNFQAVWHFSTPTSTLSLNDSTANDLNGVNNGVTATSSGQIDGAAFFNGSNAYVGLSSAPNVANLSFSISLWAKRTTTGSYTDVYSQGTRTTDQGLELGWRDDSHIYMSFINQDLDSAVTYSDSNWHNIVGTYSTSTTLWSLYIDGTLSNSNTGNGPYIGTGAASIGNDIDGNGNANSFPGPIDEVKVSKTALTPSWIATEYNNQNSPSTFYALSSENSFADLTPPAVSWIAPALNATVSSKITLTASSTDNVAVASVAFYGGSFGGSFASSTLIGSTSTASGTLYSVSWNTNNAANGSTTLWALATDTSNNTSTATTTVNVENPPVISGVATSTTSSTATISWNTNNAANSQVNYGLTLSYGSSTTTSTLVMSHSLTLTNLTTNTLYHYEIVSTDGQGNVATTTDATFMTAENNSSPPPLIVSEGAGSVRGGISSFTSVTITSPASNVVLSGVATISVTTIPSAQVTSVWFTLDGITLTTDFFNASSLVPGPHTLVAYASDIHGDTAVSAPVTFTVGNGGAGTVGGTGTGTASTPSPASAPYVFTRNLKFGMSGSDVTELQVFLITENKGSKAEKLAAVGATGFFGFLTENALAEYQRAEGIAPAVGFFGPVTRAELQRMGE